MTVRALPVRTSLTVTDATTAALPGRSKNRGRKIGGRKTVPNRHDAVGESQLGGSLIATVILGLCNRYRRYCLMKAEGDRRVVKSRRFREGTLQQRANMVIYRYC